MHRRRSEVRGPLADRNREVGERQSAGREDGLRVVPRLDDDIEHIGEGLHDVDSFPWWGGLTPFDDRLRFRTAND